MFSSAFAISGHVLFAISMIITIPVIPIYWIYRKEPVFQHRNVVLEAIYFVLTMSLMGRFYYTILYLDLDENYTSCAGVVWFAGLQVRPVSQERSLGAVSEANKFEAYDDFFDYLGYLYSHEKSDKWI